MLKNSDWLLLWYALMQTHVHLSLVAGNTPLKSWLQPLHTGFAVWLNLRGRRRGLRTRGPVFADQPKTVNFSDYKAGYLGAYIHNNPVRARVVRNAADSTRTSHRAYIGLEPVPEFLRVAKGRALSGNEDSVRGRLQFHEYVTAHGSDPRDSRLSGEQIATIRNAERVRHGPTVELRSPRVTGKGVFYETQTVFEAHQRAAFEGTPIEFLKIVAEITGLPVRQMQSSSRDRRTTSARKTAVLAWRAFDRRTGEIAASLAIGAAAATQLARRGATHATHDDESRQNAETVVDCFRCPPGIGGAEDRKK